MIVFVKVSGDEGYYEAEVSSVEPKAIERELNLGLTGPAFFVATKNEIPVMVRAALVVSIELLSKEDSIKSVEARLKKRDDQEKA